MDRLPAEGMLAPLREQADHQTQYRFGREPDGSPTPPWDWNDLE